MGKLLAVGLGGGLGALLRYAISLLPVKTEFPLLTLLTNLAGAILIGFLVGLASHWPIPDKWMLFLKTGLCGGFTTFSTFSLEAVQLFESGKYLSGGGYVLLSLLLCLCGTALGQFLGKFCFQA